MGVFRLSFFLVALSALGCSGESTSKQQPKHAPLGEYHQLYTPRNSMEGQWIVERVVTRRQDANSQLLEQLVANQHAQVLLEVSQISEDQPNPQLRLKIQSMSDQQLSSDCKIQIQSPLAYCCFEMLRITFNKIPSNYTTSETPLGCSVISFGMHADVITRGLMGALTESAANSEASIYHFLYNKAQDRILLQTPPPSNKFKTRERDYETQLYLVRQ
jgi:hypothetical protein